MAKGIHSTDRVTRNFLRMAQAVSVNRWDAPYGAAEEEPFLHHSAKGDYVNGGPDERGKIDWNNGILSKIFGYGDEKMTQLITDQIRTGVIHTSSVFLNEPAVEFKKAAAKALAAWGEYKILPASSGTIADSMALRIALAKVSQEKPGKPVRYIIPKNGYSGADFRANAMCGLDDWQGKSTPVIQGVSFIHSTFEDLAPFDALKQIPPDQVEAWFVANVDNDKAVPILLIEAGELGVGGFRRMTTAWMKAITRAVKKRGGVVICDCVQTFPGRSDRGLWGFERWIDDKTGPDIVTTAKGLGDGMPIGLTAVKKELADLVDGKWFDTFAANPLAAVVAREVLRRAQTKKIIGNVDARGAELREGLLDLQRKLGDRIRGVVGARLMSGLAVDPGKLMPVRAAAQKKGLLIGTGAAGTIRLAPHLDTSSRTIEKGVEILHDAIMEAA